MILTPKSKNLLMQASKENLTSSSPPVTVIINTNSRPASQICNNTTKGQFFLKKKEDDQNKDLYDFRQRLRTKFESPLSNYKAINNPKKLSKKAHRQLKTGWSSMAHTYT